LLSSNWFRTVIMLIKSINLIYSNNRSKLCESIFKFGKSSIITNRHYGLIANKQEECCYTKHRVHYELTNDKDTGVVLESNDGQLNLNMKKKLMRIALGNGQFYQFPYVWLRDNCQCSSCFHNDSNSRTIDWETFDVNVYPKSVKVKKIQLSFDTHIFLFFFAIC
jgi:hypothetical protein